MPVNLRYGVRPQRRLASAWLALAVALLLGALVVGASFASELHLAQQPARIVADWQELAWTYGLALLLLGLAVAGGLTLAPRAR